MRIRKVSGAMNIRDPGVVRAAEIGPTSLREMVPLFTLPQGIIRIYRHSTAQAISLPLMGLIKDILDIYSVLRTEHALLL